MDNCDSPGCIVPDAEVAIATHGGWVQVWLVAEPHAGGADDPLFMGSGIRGTGSPDLLRLTFVLERSTDGVSWDERGSINAAAEYADTYNEMWLSPATVSFMDQPGADDWTYRLRVVTWQSANQAHFQEVRLVARELASG